MEGRLLPPLRYRYPRANRFVVSEELLDVQFLGAAFRLPQVVGKLHLQPVLRRASKRLGQPRAISAVMPERPLRIEERVLRVTPKPFAASVTLRSSALRQSSRTISPGCGGLYIPEKRDLIVVPTCFYLNLTDFPYECCFSIFIPTTRANLIQHGLECCHYGCRSRRWNPAFGYNVRLEGGGDRPAGTDLFFKVGGSTKAPRTYKTGRATLVWNFPPCAARLPGAGRR